MKRGIRSRPGADLLLSKPYEELMAGVLEARHIGRGVVECEHLAFRNLDTDWQIWADVGDRSVPRKYVITSKAVGAAPQYTQRLRDWKTGISPAPDPFAFKPPEGATGVVIALLPATPMRYAGVARRTTRRAAADGAATGAGAAGTHYYAAPGCEQVVNSYGQIVYRCP